MLKVNDLYGRKVYVPKKAKKGKDGQEQVKFSKLGKVHMAVFSPNGREVVGFLVSRPEIAGMVKRPDAFLAFDSYAVQDDGTLRVTRGSAALDDDARKRLALEWDACVMWAGMDAKTVGGKKLGYVSDAEFDAKTGAVSKFFVGDGGVAARAGEGYAKAKVKGAEAAQKAGKAAGEAVDKGSYAFGRMLGRAKRAIEDATADGEAPAPKKQTPQAPAVPAADVRVSEPVETLRAGEDERSVSDEPRTYSPASESAPAQGQKTVKKPAATSASKPAKSPAKKPAAKKPTGDAAAKAVGKQIGRMGKMFSSFKDEFDKASK